MNEVSIIPCESIIDIGTHSKTIFKKAKWKGQEGKHIISK